MDPSGIHFHFPAEVAQSAERAFALRADAEDRQPQGPKGPRGPPTVINQSPMTSRPTCVTVGSRPVSSPRDTQFVYRALPDGLPLCSVSDLL
jgi:hypothetical protein